MTDLEKIEEAEEMIRIWDVLDEREKLIVTLHFGLKTGKPMSLATVAKTIGFTKLDGNPASETYAKNRMHELCTIAVAKLRRARAMADKPVTLYGIGEFIYPDKDE